METKQKNKLYSWLLLGLWMVVPMAYAEEVKEHLPFEYQYFEATNKLATVLWLPSEQGVLVEERQAAKRLSEQGITVFLPDLFERDFLPNVPSSLNEIKQADWLELISVAKRQSEDKPFYIVTSNLASAQVLKALVKLQQTPVSGIGLILLNPNLYIETPALGQQAFYWNELSQLNLPVYIIQAELSPWRWQLKELQTELSKGGSDVFLQIKKAVRDRYYFREDALKIEKIKARALPNDIVVAMQRLSPYLSQLRQSALLTEKQSIKQVVIQAGSADIKSYSGQQNLPLSLVDLTGKKHTLAKHKGKVVLLNFWASWCPPCVHEIPSMARLKVAMQGKPFEILAANLAEEKPEIEAFIKSHPVNFPILLDPAGSAVKDWKVFAYPSTYLIDKKGIIRYALFGGYEWDSAEAVQKITELMAE